MHVNHWCVWRERSNTYTYTHAETLSWMKDHLHYHLLPPQTLSWMKDHLHYHLLPRPIIYTITSYHEPSMETIETLSRTFDGDFILNKRMFMRTLSPALSLYLYISIYQTPYLPVFTYFCFCFYQLMRIAYADSVATCFYLRVFSQLMTFLVSLWLPRIYLSI